MNQEARWWNIWDDSLFLDDKLWLEAMITSRSLEERRGGVAPNEAMRTPEDAMIFRFINLGLIDLHADEREWASARRAMWLAAGLSHRLWQKAESERERVS